MPALPARPLHDGAGPSTLSRFDRDALTQPRARTIIPLEGINDILPQDETVTAEQLIYAYSRLVARAHAAGFRIIAGTLRPVEGSGYISVENDATGCAWRPDNRTPSMASSTSTRRCATRRAPLGYCQPRISRAK
jgi:hypothetical protein